MAGREGRGVWIGVALALALVLAVAAAVVGSGAPPDGPVAVDWDGTRCARCGMLVSEPAFAAQRHLADGRVLHYDDPGCLLADDRDGETEHAAWVHHHREDRWLPLDQAGFVRVPHSPMGFGLAAVAVGEDAEGIDVAAARRAVAGGTP